MSDFIQHDTAPSLFTETGQLRLPTTGETLQLALDPRVRQAQATFARHDEGPS